MHSNEIIKQEPSLFRILFCILCFVTITLVSLAYALELPVSSFLWSSWAYLEQSRSELHDAQNETLLKFEHVEFDGPTVTQERKPRYNFASVDIGAKLLNSNAEAKKPSRILNEEKDKYMMNPRSAKRKWVTIELSEEISMEGIALANFEYYSCSVKHFHVLGSSHYPCKSPSCQWELLGSFRAENTHRVQTFLLKKPRIVKFVKILFLTHYGDEFFCTLSLVRVHGSTLIDELKEEVAKTSPKTTLPKHTNSHRIIPNPKSATHSPSNNEKNIETLSSTEKQTKKQQARKGDPQEIEPMMKLMLQIVHDDDESLLDFLKNTTNALDNKLIAQLLNQSIQFDFDNELSKQESATTPGVKKMENEGEKISMEQIGKILGTLRTRTVKQPQETQQPQPTSESTTAPKTLETTPSIVNIETQSPITTSSDDAEKSQDLNNGNNSSGQELQTKTMKQDDINTGSTLEPKLHQQSAIVKDEIVKSEEATNLPNNTQQEEIISYPTTTNINTTATTNTSATDNKQQEEPTPLYNTPQEENRVLEEVPQQHSTEVTSSTFENNSNNNNAAPETTSPTQEGSSLLDNLLNEEQNNGEAIDDRNIFKSLFNKVKRLEERQIVLVRYVEIFKNKFLDAFRDIQKVLHKNAEDHNTIANVVYSLGQQLVQQQKETEKKHHLHSQQMKQIQGTQKEDLDKVVYDIRSEFKRALERSRNEMLLGTAAMVFVASCILLFCVYGPSHKKDKLRFPPKQTSDAEVLIPPIHTLPSSSPTTPTPQLSEVATPKKSLLAHMYNSMTSPSSQFNGGDMSAVVESSAQKEQ